MNKGIVLDIAVVAAATFALWLKIIPSEAWTSVVAAVVAARAAVQPPRGGPGNPTGQSNGIGGVLSLLFGLSQTFRR